MTIHSRLQFQTELLERVYNPVRSGLDRVTQMVTDLRRDQTPFLENLLDHVFNDTGKRVRPAITLMSAKFHPNDGQNAETMAAAVEVLHTATLVHDDAVDDSHLRRGKATISTLHGIPVALLFGDYLLSEAANLVCKTKNMTVIQRFSHLLTELTTGQLNEISESHPKGQTKEKYFQRIYRKTASLFSAAAECGAILSGADKQTVNHLKDYGYNLGMAFQIVDDTLDFDASEEETGKPIGSDLSKGIITLPAIIAIEQYPTDNPILLLFSDSENEPMVKTPIAEDGLKNALNLIQNSSVKNESYAIATEFCKSALISLNTLEENESRKSLEELAICLMSRRS